MQAVQFGLLAGLGLGLFNVAMMLPLRFPDKRTALTAAFLSRFAIGFLTPLCQLPFSQVLTGAIVGLLISLPDAVVTKAYLPIIPVGIIGGSIVGFLATQFVV